MYFYCYSIKLKNFLKLQGLQYIRKGRHRNGNIYWLFAKGETLDACLLLWKKYKKNFWQV